MRPTLQRCPNCLCRVDVSIYVAGQRARCPKCHVRFAVPGDGGALDTSAPTLVRGLATPPRDADTNVDAAWRATEPGEPPHVTEPDPPSVCAEPPAPQRGPGTEVDAPPLIPGLTLLDRLGGGGMGEVYRARQLSLDRLVAVKVLKASLAARPDFVARFEREGRALAALSHPNIVAIHDRGESGGSCWLAMELVEGPSLRARLGEGRLAPREAVELVAKVARAVAVAHARGIVHRDLKPENILLAPGGEPKVADFGLAGLGRSPGAAPITQPAVAMGTAQYMAPEQRRDAANAGPRADLYSLGVMLYELVAGELPQGRFAPASTRARGVPPGVDAIVGRALEADPEKRFSSATELAEALERTLRGAVRPRRLRRRDLGAWGFGAAAVVLALVTVAARIHHDDLPRSIASTPRAPLAPPSAAVARHR